MTKPAVEYSQELAERIAADLAGGKSLSQICDGDHMPTLQAVCRWEGRKPEFAQLLSEARRAQSERIVAELLDPFKVDKDPQRARVLSDNRKWLAARLAPKVYGDKLEIEIESKVSIAAALDAGRERALSAYSTAPAYSTRLINHDATLLVGLSEPDWMT